MKPKHWRLIGVAAAIVVVLAGGFVVVAPNRSAAGELRASAAVQEQTADQLRSRISLLKKQNEEIPAQLAKLAAVQKRMPEDTAVPSLIRSITAAAGRASVTLETITPSQPVEMAAPPAPAPAQSSAPADEAAATDAAEAGDAVDGTAQAAPASAVARVQRLPLAVTACGSYAELRKYLSELERLSRAMSVSGVSIGRGACGSSEDESDLTASITASVFILPKADASTGPGSATGGDAATNGAS